MDLKVTEIIYYNKCIKYFIDDIEVNKECYNFTMSKFIWNEKIREYKSELIKVRKGEQINIKHYNIDTNMKIKIGNYIKNTKNARKNI